LVDIGDHLDRARWETEGTDGSINKAVLETSSYDVVTLGNNELLTFSHEELDRLYTNSSFQVICCNVLDPLFPPYQTYERNGIKLAFIGVTVAFYDLYQSLGWKVTNPFEAVQAQVRYLRQKGYHILVLSHLGYPSDVQMANEIEGIDVIMGGHTHHLLEVPEKIKGTTIAAAGKYGRYIGHLELMFDERDHLISVQGASSLLKEEQSDEIKEVFARYQPIAERNLNEPVANVEENLDVNWREETPFANLLAASLVKWTGVEFGFVNNGQLLYSLPKGIVTKRALHTACPHPINPVVLAVKGKDVKETLEQSLLMDFMEKEIHGFGFRGKELGCLAIAGMTVVYNPTNPPYQKIQQIYMGKNKLDDDNIYHIATISMFVFGVGYPLLKKAEVLHYYLPESLRVVLADGLHSYQLRKNCYQKRWIISSPKEE
jgi:2',3'-cyclic-nucleotide 2'-phosphodiesterase (5'-nucleotidase family)